MSTAAFWRDGEQVWSVDHFGQEGRWHLGVSGALPDFFDEVQAMRMAQQSAQGAEDIDDIFEIPLDMAEKCCGFRHDIGTFDFRELVEA